MLKWRWKRGLRAVNAVYKENLGSQPGSGPLVFRADIMGEPQRGDPVLTAWKMVYADRRRKHYVKRHTARAVDNNFNVLHSDGDSNNLLRESEAGNITEWRVLRCGQSVRYKGEPWHIVAVGAKIALQRGGGARVQVDPDSDAITWE